MVFYNVLCSVRDKGIFALKLSNRLSIVASCILYKFVCYIDELGTSPQMYWTHMYFLQLFNKTYNNKQNLISKRFTYQNGTTKL